MHELVCVCVCVWVCVGVGVCGWCVGVWVSRWVCSGCQGNPGQLVDCMLYIGGVQTSMACPGVQ